MIHSAQSFYVILDRACFLLLLPPVPFPPQFLPQHLRTLVVSSSHAEESMMGVVGFALALLELNVFELCAFPELFVWSHFYFHLRACCACYFFFVHSASSLFNDPGAQQTVRATHFRFLTATKRPNF